MQVEDATYGIELGRFSIERPADRSPPSCWPSIVNKTQAAARLTGAFATLYPLIEAYLAQRCFGSPVDLDDEDAAPFLANPVNQDRIATFLGRQLGQLIVEERTAHGRGQPDPAVSRHPAFLWRRQHQPMDKTIFNEVATFNPFETSFARSWRECSDIRRFAALAEHFTGFWVDYLKPSGAIGRYFPDWVAVQDHGEGT